MLQKLLPVIEGQSLVLYERGDFHEIPRHRDFRLFACMNPGNEVGKKELPVNLKEKFTELFICDELDQADLEMLVTKQLSQHL